MKKELVAASLVPVLLPLATASTVRGDGVFPDSVCRDLYQSAQKAVILYGNSTEHLILSVSFEGDAESFTWIVLAPNKREIAVTDSELFWELSDLAATGYSRGRRGTVSCVLAGLLRGTRKA